MDLDNPRFTTGMPVSLFGCTYLIDILRPRWAQQQKSPGQDDGGWMSKVHNSDAVHSDIYSLPRKISFFYVWSTFDVLALGGKEGKGWTGNDGWNTIDCDRRLARHYSLAGVGDGR